MAGVKKFRQKKNIDVNTINLDIFMAIIIAHKHIYVNIYNFYFTIMLLDSIINLN